MSGARVVEQIEVVVVRLSNGVERLVSAKAKVGVPFVPEGAQALDLDDAMVREFLYAGAMREGFDIPVDASLVGGVWSSDNRTHILAWHE